MIGEPWPEADALFHRDPRFLGSDDAYSVPLGDDRTLWLFGDTFVGDGQQMDRRKSHFIRNSIGIQTGPDPSNANVDFFWRNDPSPDSFFTTKQGEWLWPLHGARIADTLLLFFMQVRGPHGGVEEGSDPIDDWRDEGALSFFDVYDWEAFVIANPDDPPSKWDIQQAKRPKNPRGLVAGATLLPAEDHLLGYAWKGEDLFLSRWVASEAASGDLRKTEWWTPGGWTLDSNDASPIADEAKTEFTVHRDPAKGKLCMVQMRALIGAHITVRWADEPHGPWSELEKIYEPAEAEMPGVMTYAAKAHPQLTGADLVLTYASNGSDADSTLDNLDIYFPRFVKVSFEEST
ncbi:MAG: DUF4185 domain-containing protein [Actinomycetota bacterium]|nr:hypothetical protein [Actinomycetota bacterium]